MLFVGGKSTINIGYRSKSGTACKLNIIFGVKICCITVKWEKYCLKIRMQYDLVINKITLLFISDFSFLVTVLSALIWSALICALKAVAQAQGLRVRSKKDQIWAAN